jgi:hypothetical protein
MLQVEKGHNGVPEAEMTMRGDRFNLEDQVGGLIDHSTRRSRRRRQERDTTPEPVDELRYSLYASDTATVRASRADERDVA